MSKFTALYARTFFAEPGLIFQQNVTIMRVAREKSLGNLRLFFDDGYAGDDDSRPSFNAMMEEVRKHRIDTVLVLDGHYLEQRADRFWEIVRTIHEHGVRLILVRENMDILPDEVQEDVNILDDEPHFKTPSTLDPRAGKWGQMRSDYLEEERPGEYHRLFANDIVDETMIEVNEVAERRMEKLVHQMQESEGVTETLKAENLKEWILRMNSIRARAADIVKEELIFT